MPSSTSTCDSSIGGKLIVPSPKCAGILLSIPFFLSNLSVSSMATLRLHPILILSIHRLIYQRDDFDFFDGRRFRLQRHQSLYLDR